MAKGADIFVEERGEAVEGAEVGVEQQLGKGADLRGAIPTVGAVNEQRAAAGMQLVGAGGGAAQEGGEVR